MPFPSLSSVSGAASGDVQRAGWAPNPTVVGSVVDLVNLDGARGCAVVGRYAYVCGYFAKALSVIDVVDPTTPVILSTLTDAADLNGARNIDVVGKYAYVVTSIAGTLTIIDISNPSAPVKVGVVGGTPMAGGHRIRVIGRYAYTTGLTHFAIIDVSNPAAPVIAGSVTHASQLDDNYGFDIVGRYAYVSVSAGNALTIIDISNPAAPTIVGSVTIAGAHSASLAGRYCYVTSAIDDAMYVVDVKNPASPVVVGSVAGMNGAHTVTVLGRYCYLTANSADSLYVIDVLNPAAPTIVATLTDNVNLDDTRSGHIIVGRNMYIPAWGSSRFTVVDLDGLRVPNLGAGSVSADEARFETVSARRLNVHSGLAVGPEGVQSQGPADFPTLTVAGQPVLADVFDAAVFGKAVSSNGFSTFTQLSTRYNGGSRKTSVAPDAEVVFRLHQTLWAGTWTIVLLQSQTTDRGIHTVATSPDGTTWTDLTTIDGYAATLTQARSEVTGLTMPAGVKYLRLKMSTKNASSSSYNSEISGLYGLRTGA